MRQMRDFVRQQYPYHDLRNLLIALSLFQNGNHRLRTVARNVFQPVEKLDPADSLAAHQDVPAGQFQRLAKSAQEDRSHFRKLEDKVTPNFRLAENSNRMFRHAERAS